MAPLEVWDPSTPPSTLSSSSATTCDSSESSESSDDNSAPAVSRTRCMNPGRRRIGGRIYDSVLGVTCHWCRQKTVEDHVFCCHCNLAFCGGCLRNRHGEDIEIEMKDDVKWTCPKCRGGCGPGCKNCCNCGPCRKTQGMDPTGLLVHKARAHGFTNVHDYLIHQKTGESEETIAKRKHGKGWCQTDPSSFRMKQKRIEDENGVEATCRKRLNFTSNDSDLQEKKRDKSFQPNALQVKEASPASSMPKGEEVSQVGSLRNEDGSLKEPERKVIRPKREPDPHDHEEPSQKRAISSPRQDSNMQPHFQGNTVQPKLEPDSYVHEEPRNRASSSSVGKATDVQPHSQCEMQIRPSLPVQRHPSDRTDALSLLHVKDEPITYERDAQQLVIVKKEPSEPVSQPKHCAYSRSQLRRVKTEELPLCNETSPSEQTIKDIHLRQVKKEFLEQQGQITEGLNVQSMHVKEESQDQCSQPNCVSSNMPNAFGAAFSRGESDAAWCRFREDFEVPSENVEGSTSTSAFLNYELPRNTGDARSLASPSVSNFHLYPESVLPVFSHVKEVVNGKCVFRSDVAVNRESMSTQEAQCNTAPCGPVTNKCCKDGSMDATQSPISFPLSERTTSIAAVKEESEEVWNVHYPSPAAKSTMNASYTNSLLGTVKVKTERKDFSFTIEPSVYPCPIISKSERLPLRQVKQEVIDDMPMSKVICIDDEESLAVPEKDNIEISAGLTKSSSFGAVSHLWKVDDFKNKLKAKLLEPFSKKELDELAAAASHRKPIYKVRETRQGCFQFMSEEEGFSYLDHHPELDLQLKQAVSPIAKLSLLRGFFFWLEHASTQGAFKPWTSVSRPPEVQENDDCVEIEGPDCEILAVVCSVDEEVNGERSSGMTKNSTIVS